MRGFIVLLCLLLASPAIAGKTDTTWNPPTRFDHPYSGTMIIHRLPQAQIVKTCADVIGKRSMIQHGCSSLPKDNRCEIWIVEKTYMGASPESVLRHEIGHCNGWPGNHPD
jgi:hypothetical protein